MILQLYKIIFVLVVKTINVLSKIKKILTNLLIALVLLANASYAVSYSICEMTKQSSCYCSMDSDEEQGTNSGDTQFTSKSCCTNEVKLINNSSDFEQHSKVEINVNSFVLHFSDLLNAVENNHSNLLGKEVLIFYQPRLDIPVIYSSLLI